MAESKRNNSLLLAGCIAFLVAASVFGVLEVHSSTDTWIGLACGRLVADSLAEHHGVPTKDTFSFTMAGQTSYNQNWLTHLGMWLVYSRLGPTALVISFWLMAASIFWLSGLAAWWRSRSRVGALLAAAMVGVGGRDFLSARPATSGFFLMALLAMLLAAIDGQREKRRWWPVIALFPLLLVWGCAHGSFVFAFGLLGIYVACWAVTRFVFRTPPAASGRQIITLCGILALSFLLLVAFGPFHLDNFIHPQKVASSPLWRQVSEWQPPYRNVMQSFPPMVRFWCILGCTTACLLILALLAALGPNEKTIDSARAQRSNPSPAKKPAKDIRFCAKHGGPLPCRACGPASTILFDLVVIGISLGMTLWARRFAPMFYIFSAPVILCWIQRLGGRALRNFDIKLYLSGMAWGGCAIVSLFAALRAEYDLNEQFEKKPGMPLLERVTRYDQTPQDAIQYLDRNHLAANLFSEWTIAGCVMFFAPETHVFMDGRAQQTYDELTYEQYLAIINSMTASNQASLLDLMVRRGTDAVLLRPSTYTIELLRFLERSNEWTEAYIRPSSEQAAGSFLLLRNGSPVLARAIELVRTGKEWRPDWPGVQAGRGNLRLAANPPDIQGGLRDWMDAIEADSALGLSGYPVLANRMRSLGRVEEARAYFNREMSRVRQDSTISKQEHEYLLEVLQQCLAHL